MTRRPACPGSCVCPCHQDGNNGAKHDPEICPPVGSAKWRFLQSRPNHRKYPLGGALKAVRDRAADVDPGSPEAYLLDDVNRLLDAVDDVLALPLWAPGEEDPGAKRLPDLVRLTLVKRAIEGALVPAP